MGILDDAIRDHLDLKRKHGAASDDVERLEREAFGPATRPGDPEFADEAGEAREVELEDEGGPSPGAVQDWSEVIEENTEDHPEVTEGESEAVPGGEGMTQTEQGRIDYDHLEDTADHPVVPEVAEPEVSPAETSESAAPEPVPEPPAVEEPPAEVEGDPAEPPEAAIFDQDEDEFEDPDVAADDDREPMSGTVAEPEAEREPPADRATEAEPPAAVPDVEEERAVEEAPAPVEEREDEDEGLLGETPEFLEDTPEDERLWFEQGEPKDFDFDD